MMVPGTHGAPFCQGIIPGQMLSILDGWQRAFPLIPRPYAAIARATGLDEGVVMSGLADLQREGVLGRVGATIRPNTVGVSMLAAMQVPPERLDEVARIVNAEPGVNHNYEREHAINLWFVIAAPDAQDLSDALLRIRTASGLDILELPLERSYYIDLGFSLQSANRATSSPRSVALTSAVANPVGYTLEEVDGYVLQALERGLLLVPRPYLALAGEIGLSETEVIARIQRLIAAGVITRFGLIVRHRRLGYRANAMVVFDVEDDRVDTLGARFAQQDFVTLCYRRPRHGMRWPYNLFCMIHGSCRDRVTRQAEQLAEVGDLGERMALLFSRRCYLQRGTRIAPSVTQHQEAAQ